MTLRVLTFAVIALLAQSLFLPLSSCSAQETSSGDLAQETAEPTFGEKWSVVWADEDSSSSAKWQNAVNLSFGTVVDYLAAVLFYAVYVGFGVRFPVVLLILIFGGIFFTLRFGFINVRMFRHSIQVIRGKFDSPEDAGEVSHFQALTSALSATVGLGNIAGVAAAIAMGGPGAIFWMWVCAFCGMSLKFTSCSLAQYYRRVKPDGSVLGGPMVYLDDGIRDRFPALAPHANSTIEPTHEGN